MLEQIDRYIKYARENPDSIGRYERMAIERFLRDIEDPRYEYREDEVSRAIEFMQSFRHFEGSHANKQFILSDWQVFIIANLVGLYHKGKERRKYTRSYIQVARKSGKTFFSVVLSLYFFLADKEQGAGVYFAANSKKQSNIAFRMAKILCHQLDPKNKLLRNLHSDIFYDKTNSTLSCLAADENKMDGYNASFGLIDEYHEAKSDGVYNAIARSMGMRSKPLICTITTAGFDKDAPCYAYRMACIDVLTGVVEDENQFALIFELDENDDYTNPENWRKCNPNIGQTVLPEFMQESVNEAKTHPEKVVDIKTKTFNYWCDSATNWIPEQDIQACLRPVEWDEFIDKEVYVGVDLSMTDDLTAMAFMHRDENGNPVFKTQYFIPESKLNNSIISQKYKLWVSQGFIEVTPGNAVDYNYIAHSLLEKFNNNFCIQMVAYDAWMANQWAILCTNEGLPLQPYSQSIGAFNRPTQEFKRRALTHTMALDKNPVNVFCLRNVEIKMDHNGNQKPDKTNCNNQRKIDGVIAMLNALGGCMSMELG